MPALIVALLRPIIMALVSGVAVTTVINILDGTIDRITSFLKSQYGFTDEDSIVVVANYFLEAITISATLFALIKGKIPTKIAQRLGFTSKGFVKQQVSAGGVAKLTQLEKTDPASLSLFKKSMYAFVVSFATSLPWLPSLIQNISDQGVFNARQSNNILEAIGLGRLWPEPEASSSPGPFSTAEFDDYARSIETTGIKGIEYPLGSFLYSKTQLAKLVDWVYGQRAVKGETVTAKSIIPLLAPYLITSGAKTTTQTSSTSSTSNTLPTVIPKVQVFTGVVSQGVLGQGASFTARTNDMIDDTKELLESASVNLAPFLVALPTRITYELKIVASYTTKDGFTQRGQAVKVISGYAKNGTPQYKTITNKFAVLYLYVLSDKGTRTKIQTVVLGPVNSANFNVTQTNLAEIEKALQGIVTTSDVADIKGIVTTNAVFTQTPIATTPKVTAPVVPIYTPTPTPIISAPVVTQTPGLHFIIGRFGSSEVVTDTTLQALGSQVREVSFAEWNANPQKTINTADQEVLAFIAKAQGQTTPTQQTSSVVPAVQRPGLNAQTLSEWYTANRQALPSVQARSLLYQQYGLGMSNLYVGSAEQNTRLLEKLKGL